MSNIIYFGLCFIIFVIFLYIFIRMLKVKNWFNIINLTYLSLLFLYVIPILFRSFDWTRDIDFLFIIFIGLVGYFVSIIFADIYKYESLNNYTFKYEFNSRFINLFFIIIILFHAIQIIPLDIYSFSKLINFLLRDRVGDYLDNPIIKRSLLIKPLIDTVSYILIFYYWKHKRYKLGTFLWLILLINKLLFSHTRFVILMDLLLPLFFYNFYIKRVKLTTISIVFVIVLMFISLGNFARGGYLNAESIKLATSSEVVFNQIIRASAGSTDTFYKFYLMEPEKDLLKQYYYYLPISFIPRAFWDEKPIVSYFWRVTKEITGNYPQGKGNPVLTTTFFGEAYHQLGIFGVFISMLTYLAFLLLFLKVINKFQYTELIIFKIIIHIPMDIRGGFNSFFISQISYIYPLLLLLLICAYKLNKVQDKNIEKQMI